MDHSNSIGQAHGFKDLAGLQFNRWTVLEFSGKNGSNAYWKCRCECGNVKNVSGHSIVSGTSRSCGCLSREESIERFTTHGKTKTAEYRSWQQMINRCYNQNCPAYARYGGRGITVCDRWRKSFVLFLEDVGEKPTPKHSIDRIDNDGNYEPNNCRWSDPKEQARNRRSSRFLTFKGRTKLLVEWAEEIGIKPNTLKERIRAHGWSVERALTTPVLKRR